VGDVAKAAGVGHSIKFRGKAYELKPETPEMIGRVEVWLEGQAWASAKRAARFLKPAEHAALLRDTGRDIAAGVYSYGSQYYATATRTMAGFRERLLLAIRAGDPSADEELVAAMTDDKAEREAFAEAVRLMNLRDGVAVANEDEGDDADRGTAGTGGE
jgi:hypothetical protein